MYLFTSFLVSVSANVFTDIVRYIIGKWLDRHRK